MRENSDEISGYWFDHAVWDQLSLDEKRALVKGSMYFLNLWLKDNICWNEREKSQYDQFSARITVAEIIDYVEKTYQRPECRNEDADNLIMEYLQYNFFDYIGQPIVYQG